MGADGRGDDEFFDSTGMYKASEGYDMDAFDRIISGDIKIDKTKAAGGSRKPSKSAPNSRDRYKGERAELMDKLNARRGRGKGESKRDSEKSVSGSLDDDYKKIQAEKEALEAKIQAEKDLILEKLEIKHRKEKERLLKQAAEAAERERQRRREEAERLERERLEQERLERERLERERQERERLERERLERERQERERLERERLERERLERERLERERQERLERERQERERLERERLEQERLEQERLEQARLEQERLEREKLEAERQEQERLDREKVELGDESTTVGYGSLDYSDDEKIVEIENGKAELIRIGNEIDEQQDRKDNYEVPSGLSELEKLEYELNQAKEYARKLEELLKLKKETEDRVRELEAELDVDSVGDVVDLVGSGDTSDVGEGELTSGEAEMTSEEVAELDDYLEYFGLGFAGVSENEGDGSEDKDFDGSGGVGHEELENEEYTEVESDKEETYDPLDMYLEVDDDRLAGDGLDSSAATYDNTSIDDTEEGDLESTESVDDQYVESLGRGKDGVVEDTGMGSRVTEDRKRESELEDKVGNEDIDIAEAQRKAQELLAKIQERDAEQMPKNVPPKEARSKVIKPPKHVIKGKKVDSTVDDGEDFTKEESDLVGSDYIEVYNNLVDKYTPKMDEVDADVLKHGRNRDYLRAEIIGVLVNHGLDAISSGGSDGELELLYEEALYSYDQIIKEIEQGVHVLMPSEVEIVEELMNECISDIEEARSIIRDI